MGRKGMKGFMKGVHKHDGTDEDELNRARDANEQPGTSVAKPAAAPEQQQDVLKAPQPAKPSDKPGDDAETDDDSDEEGTSKGPETRGKLMQRHKREMAAHKKAVQKLGSKKKDEAAKLTAEIEARHARELAELEEREKHQQEAAVAVAGTSGGRAAGSAVDATTQGVTGLSLEGPAAAAAAAEHKKPSKAQKRREKLAQQDAEREQRIAAEQAALGPSNKAVEEEQLQVLLLPLKLGIREIRADGHCLYRAVEDQLVQAGAGAAGSSGPPLDHLALRRLAAAHIRAHPDEFLPFIHDEDAVGGPEEQLESYCAELEGSAVWGGQLELGALAQALKKQIKVYALGMPTVTLGDEYASSGVLQVCYLRHAFGLGEHYNSVAPLTAAGDADE